MDKSPTIFFSVDVETTHTNPREGRLLTIGIQPVLWKQGVPAELMAHQFYARIDQTDYYDEWFKTLTDLNSTLSWWLKQDERVQMDGFRDLKRPRLEPLDAATQLAMFVDEVCADVGVDVPLKHRVFCANPVVFDKAWFDAFWYDTVESEGLTHYPFHYRALCLRAMHFGIHANDGWDSWGRSHAPDLPHHALSDAIAQALDLKALLDSRLPNGNGNG